MTDQEINIAIAESAGWHPHPDNDKREQKFWTFGGIGYGLPNGVAKPVAAIPYIFDDIRGDIGGLPNYCNDLNAMHEAEKFLFTMNNWEACTYETALQTETTSWAWHATAKQRAKVFLKTIGKWKE